MGINNYLEKNLASIIWRFESCNLIQQQWKGNAQRENKVILSLITDALFGADTQGNFFVLLRQEIGH